MTKKAKSGGRTTQPKPPKPKSTVQAVRPQVRNLRVTDLSRRTMYACSVKECDFHTAVQRACPRHPQASLKKVG